MHVQFNTTHSEMQVVKKKIMLKQWKSAGS